MIDLDKTEDARAKETATTELFQSFRMGWRDGAHDTAPAQRFVEHPTRADLTAMYLRGHADGSKARRDALSAIAAELAYTPSILRGDYVRVPRTTEPVRCVILDLDAIEKHAERLCEVDPTTDRTYVPELQASVLALVRLVRAEESYRSAVRHMRDIERLAEEERVADGAQQIVEINEQWSALLAASAAATKAEEALVAAGGTPRPPSFNVYEADGYGVPWERGDVRAAPGVPPGVSLVELAAKLPCRTLHGVNGPYLSRYTLTKLADGGHVFLHFFHRGDEDQELHNHPWSGTSFILTGGYREERRVGTDVGASVETRVYRPGDVSALAPDTFHRVDLLNPAEGCWTLFITGAREQTWGFWDRHTGTYTPWREFLERQGKPPDPSRTFP